MAATLASSQRRLDADTGLSPIGVTNASGPIPSVPAPFEGEGHNARSSENGVVPGIEKESADGERT